MSQETFQTHNDSSGARDAFVTARAEVLKRVELRDRMVVTYLSISIAILCGTVLSEDPTLGLLVPVFGLGAVLVVCQHTAAIHRICCWTRRVIPFPHWARSRELQGLHQSAIVLRAIAQAAIFVTPACVSIAYGYAAAFARMSVLLSGLWWLSVLTLVATVYVQCKTLSDVLAVNKRTGYEQAYQRHQTRQLERHSRPCASSAETEGCGTRETGWARAPGKA